MSQIRRSRLTGHARAVRAFTLVELLVVITIIALLVAMLVPGLSAAWQTAQMTQCKTNLNRIWQAQAVWRSDNDGRLLTGASWMGNLIQYVEWNPTVFQCHTRVAWGYSGGTSDGSAAGGEGAADGSSSSGGSGGSWDEDETASAWTPSSDEIDACFEFDIYFQEDPSGNYNVTSGGSGSGIRGPFSHSIPLGGHPWVQRFDHGTYTKYKVDDAGSTGSNKTAPSYDDIELDVHYKDGMPYKVDIIRASGANSGSIAKRFIVDFKIMGEVAIRDWAKHYGETINFEVPDQWSGDSSAGGSDGGWGDSGGGSGGWYWNGSAWVTRKPLPLIFGDYAMSRGSYERRDGSLAAGLDGRLFYILDFGARRVVADFNQGGTEEDEWDKYFILDPLVWQAAFGQECKDWRAYQALRHFGQSNVLFCDGHIESLGPEDLYYGNPLWCYQGR